MQTGISRSSAAGLLVPGGFPPPQHGKYDEPAVLGQENDAADASAKCPHPLRHQTAYVGGPEGWRQVKTRRSKVRLSRALGVVLTPKAARFMERRPTRPGQHGRARVKASDYKLRLLEKQRLRAQYNVGEQQLRAALTRAARKPGKTGENLLIELETRLDNLVLRAGFAATIYQARQAVAHGHIRVDGRRVDKPSFRVRPGQSIEVEERSKDKPPFVQAAAGAYAALTPPYLEVDRAALRARLERLPRRPEIPVQCQEQLVVEYYAR